MIYVIAHNIRSAYNIGAIFRTADGFGVNKIFLTGYSPLPARKEAIYKNAAQKMISKTALGAENDVEWESQKNISGVIKKLRSLKCEIVALEQDEKSIPYDTYSMRGHDMALIVGNEPKGLDVRTLAKCDTIIEIPMYGKKNSLNVVVAFGIVGYTIRKNAGLVA